MIKEIVKYAIEYIGVPYVLPGKFQTDNLESRFGQYRQLAGGNYNITVTQVLEAEKKELKVFWGYIQQGMGRCLFQVI